MTFADIARRAAQLAAKNSPAILTSIGVVGTVTTAYLAGKATYKLAEKITIHNDRVYDDISPVETPREIVQFAYEEGLWKHYIPAVATGAATIACIIGANHVGSRRAAGLAAAYSLTEKSFEEYKAKVVEKIGERKEDAITTEVSQDRIRRNDPEDLDLYAIDKGELCFDSFSARYFRSTVEEIRAAINEVNNQMNHDGFACLGDLYRRLDIPPTEYSDLVGWNSDRLIEDKIHSVLDKNDKPIIVLEFRNKPGPDYSRFH